MARHLYRLFRVTADGFNTHVPFEDRKVDARVLLPTPKRRRFGAPYSRVPRNKRRAALWSIVRALLPNHDPDHQPLPRFADQWLARYARGEDVTHWYSSMAAHASA
jgi:hypothetical protein